MASTRGGKARIAANIYKAHVDRYERLAALTPEAAADIRARLLSIHEEYGTHLYDLTTLVYSRLPQESEADTVGEPLTYPKPLSASTLADLAETVRNNEHDRRGAL